MFLWRCVLLDHKILICQQHGALTAWKSVTTKFLFSIGPSVETESVLKELYVTHYNSNLIHVDGKGCKQAQRQTYQSNCKNTMIVAVLVAIQGKYKPFCLLERK